MPNPSECERQAEEPAAIEAFAWGDDLDGASQSDRDLRESLAIQEADSH